MAESDSERYEYDAPSHVVDFNELEVAEFDDKWFEQQAEGGAGHLVTPLKLDCSSGKNVVSKATQPPSNIVTSWGDKGPAQAGVRPQTSAAPPRSQPLRLPKRKTTGGSSAPPTKKQKEQATSEEQELERIKILQEEVAVSRKKNEASFKAALAGNPPPKKMVLPTTVPKDFHFNSDGRAKASTSSATPHEEVDFISQLRKPSAPAKARRGATVPKPFNLSSGAKQKEQHAYVSVAQQIQQFEKQTPARYRVPSRRNQKRRPSLGKREQLKVTLPQSPHLLTVHRTRAASVKSSAELEAAELQQLHKVTALELNKKILEGPEQLKKPAVKKPTVAEGFQLEIEKRIQERQTSKKPEESEERPYNFRARPLPKDILGRVVGVPERKVAVPTVPESPAFVLPKRVREEVEEVKQPSPVKAPPVPQFGLPFQPRLPEHHHVEVCPFSFEQRERERQALKEQRLKEKQDEEFQFKAQLLPDFGTVVLPEKKKAELTKQEPFRLLLDERGAVKNSRWERMVKEEQKHQQDAMLFKARPNTVTQKEPFRPKKEGRAALAIPVPPAVQPFELATEQRAREWKELEQRANEKNALRAQMEASQRQEEEQAEKDEICRLRQEQVHKAQPIRRYKPVSVKKSGVALTVPESPNFSDRFRL